jgi:branched-chain amino acid transport system ATP-binding protein
MLEINNLDVYYGQIQALYDVSLTVSEREAVAVLGANGAGKSTLIKTVMGWQKPAGGEVRFVGQVINRLSPWERVLGGMALVPEGGRVFRDLSVGRAMMSKPKLLLIDEVSMGLMPILVKRVFGVINDLRQHGVSILLVEQNAFEALKIVDRAYVLENGHIVLEGTPDQLREDKRVKAAYLGG